MPLEIKIPHVGESVTEVQIAEWLKSEGDMVKKDENIAVIDSDKTTFELPAPEDGRLAKLLYPAGDRVKVGETVAHLETGGGGKTKTDAGKEPATKPATAKPAAATDEKAKPAEKPEKAETAEVTETPKAEVKPEISKSETPKAESQKSEKPTERADDKAVEKKPGKPEPSPAPPAKTAKVAGRGEKRVPVTMLRRTVARRLVEAKQRTAMLTTFNEVDMSAVQALRKEHQEAFKKRHETKLGIMSFFIKAAVEALKQFPQLNAEMQENEIVYRDYCDIGAAIASERGLVVPVLRNAERMSFAEMEHAVADFAQRARDGKLKPEDLEGGTFTITNGGVFGSLFSTPILNPPQSGILGMHSIQERPVACQGQVVIRPMMYVALTYDHRIVDGREAVQFLHRIKETIENPARLVIGV